MLTAGERNRSDVKERAADARTERPAPHFALEADSAGRPQPTCWGLSIGVAGMLSQMRGLAEAVGCDVEFKRTRIHSPWRWLPLHVLPKRMSLLHPDHGLTGPPPPLVIACGRHSVIPAICLKRRWGVQVLTVFIQDPIVDTRNFDLVVAPRHDRVTGENVITTLGAIHPVTRELLDRERNTALAESLLRPGRPTVTVLVGGPNKYNSYAPETVERLIRRLRNVVDRDDARLLIIGSRRTPKSVRGRLHNAFAADHFVWNNSEPNPYLAALAVADYVVVTADSVSMTSEAAATTKPVLVHDAGTRPTAMRQRRFHRAFAEAGVTRPFDGELAQWEYTPPDDTARAASAIRSRLPETIQSHHVQPRSLPRASV